MGGKGSAGDFESNGIESSLIAKQLPQGSIQSSLERLTEQHSANRGGLGFW
jgi:hypothetical protein